jgi:hypothetical protein
MSKNTVNPAGPKTVTESWKYSTFPIKKFLGSEQLQGSMIVILKGFSGTTLVTDFGQPL